MAAKNEISFGLTYVPERFSGENKAIGGLVAALIMINKQLVDIVDQVYLNRFPQQDQTSQKLFSHLQARNTLIFNLGQLSPEEIARVLDVIEKQLTFYNFAVEILTLGANRDLDWPEPVELESTQFVQVNVGFAD